MKHGYGDTKKVVLSAYQKQLNAMGCPTGNNYQKNGKTLKQFKKRRRAYLREIQRKFA